ncbi:chromosome condensation complex Condensin [Conglomerata obtusa]
MTSTTDISKIFNAVQECSSSEFKKYGKIICDEIQKQNVTQEVIINKINIFLLQGKKSNSTKIILFFKQILEELNYVDNEDSINKDTIKKEDECYNQSQLFIKHIYDHLLVCLDSKLTRVRKNALRLLKIVFENIEPENSNLIKICERLFDKEKEVVKEAINLLSKYQEMKVNKKDFIFDILKDLLRHDPNADVRKSALKNIVLNEQTINCVVEKISDIDFGIRNYFYKNIIEKIKLKMLKKDKLEFLIDKCFAERVFDFKIILAEKIIDEFDLQNNFFLFFEEHTLKNIKELLIIIFKKINVVLNDLPKSYIEACIKNVFLNMIEDEKGRDFLTVPDLEIYLTFVVDKIVNIKNVDSLYIQELLSTLKFYDFFSEKDIDKIKMLINSLILTEISDEVIESVVVMVKNIIDDNEIINIMLDSENLNFIKFLSKHKMISKETNLEYIKRIFKGPKNDLIYEIMFFYYCNFPNNEVLEELTVSKNLYILTDLFLFTRNNKLKENIETLINEGIDNLDYKIMLPLMKLLLCDSYYSQDAIIFILEGYYLQLESKLHQYATVFLHEYFLQNTTILVDIFCKTLSKLENKKLFINQTLFWLSNDKSQNDSQKLFLNICIYILQNISAKKIIIECLTVLNQIEISSSWDVIFTKKILFCVSMIIKKIENKTIINAIVGRLMMIDDGYPLDKNEINEIQDLINN